MQQPPVSAAGTPELKDFTAMYTYHLPSFWQTPAGIAVAIAGVCVVLIGLVLLWRWWRRPAPLTLKRWAQLELKALRAELGKEEVNYKVFFGALTFFINQYLFRLYTWQILDKTDEEVKVFVADKTEISAAMKQQFAELFSYAQMVKFADKSALHDKAEEALRIATQVVKELKPLKEKKRKRKR